MKEKHDLIHGDVDLLAVDSIPEDAVVVEEGEKVTVMHGEATGHSHVVTAPPGLIASQILKSEKTGKMYLRTSVGATISHEEHHKREMLWDTFEIEREKTVDPITRMRKNVID